jgi:AbrB family looped-hinge helix DNA binding protein
MRITSKGQVTIPQAIRERAGLLPNTEVEFLMDGDLVFLVKASGSTRPTRGELAVRRLQAHSREITMSTDEIMALTRGET